MAFQDFNSVTKLFIGLHGTLSFASCFVFILVTCIGYVKVHLTLSFLIGVFFVVNAILAFLASIIDSKNFKQFVSIKFII